MIGCATGERAVVHEGPVNAHPLADEDMVDAQERQARGERRPGPAAGLDLRIPETPRQQAVGRRARNGVEVAGENDARTLRHLRPEPARPDQGLGLPHALAAEQAEMGDEDLQLHPVDRHLHPERPARLAARRQSAGLDQTRRQGRQQRISVALLLEVERGMEMRDHAEVSGDGLGLVDAAAARPLHVHLLQGDDVRPALGDHGGDTAGIELAVCAEATVHVVGHHPQPTAHAFLSFLRTSWEPEKPGFRSDPSGKGKRMKRSHILHALVAGAVLVAGWLVYRTLSQYTWEDIRSSIAAIPAVNFALALAFAACSYVCLTFFDVLALRYAGKPLPYPRTALASFTSLSIGHNVGVAALSSGAVRYRFYSRWGLEAQEIAKLIVFCGVTVGLGLVTLAGICLLALPGTAGKVAGIGTGASLALGLACLLLGVIYLALAALVRGELKVRSWRFALPRPGIAALQIMVGTANFAFVAACLHQLLKGDAGYMETTAAYVVGNLTALVSHVPGGLGVLETAIGYLLGSAASIGALIAFRAVYFFIPLPLGLVCLLASEALVASKGETGLRNSPN